MAGSRDSDGRGDSEAEPQPRGKAARGSALGAAANLGRRQRLPRGSAGWQGGSLGLLPAPEVGSGASQHPGASAPWSLVSLGEPMGPVRTQTLWGG